MFKLKTNSTKNQGETQEKKAKIKQQDDDCPMCKIPEEVINQLTKPKK